MEAITTLQVTSSKSSPHYRPTPTPPQGPYLQPINRSWTHLSFCLLCLVFLGRSDQNNGPNIRPSVIRPNKYMSAAPPSSLLKINVLYFLHILIIF